MTFPTPIQDDPMTLPIEEEFNSRVSSQVGVVEGWRRGAWVELQHNSQHVILNTMWFTCIFFHIHHHEICQVGAVVPIFP